MEPAKDSTPSIDNLYEGILENKSDGTRSTQESAGDYDLFLDKGFAKESGANGLLNPSEILPDKQEEQVDEYQNRPEFACEKSNLQNLPEKESQTQGAKPASVTEEESAKSIETNFRKKFCHQIQKPLDVEERDIILNDIRNGVSFLYYRTEESFVKLFQRCHSQEQFAFKTLITIICKYISCKKNPESQEDKEKRYQSYCEQEILKAITKTKDDSSRKGLIGLVENSFMSFKNKVVSEIEQKINPKSLNIFRNLFSTSDQYRSPEVIVKLLNHILCSFLDQ